MSMPETVNFACPKCDAKMWVKDSRPTLLQGRQAVRRRRVCSKCSHRLSTVEAQFSRVQLAPQRLLMALRTAHIIIGDLIETLAADAEELLEAAE